MTPRRWSSGGLRRLSRAAGNWAVGPRWEALRRRQHLWEAGRRPMGVEKEMAVARRRLGVVSLRWERGWQAVLAGCAGGMEPEDAIVTGREPSIPARSPHVPLAPETIER